MAGMDLKVLISAQDNASAVLKSVASLCKSIAANRGAIESVNKASKVIFAGGVMAIAAVGGGILYATKKAADFEYQLKNVQKVMENTKNIHLIAVQSGQIAESMGQTREGVLEIMAGLAQAGVADRNLKDFTQTVVKMGVAWDVTSKQSAEYGKNLMANYDIKTNAGLASLVSQINYISDKSNASATGIAEVMMRIGGLRDLYKLSTSDLIAQSTVGVEAGQASESVGTALQSIYRNMTATINAFHSGVGVKSKNVKQVIKDMPEAAQAFAKAYDLLNQGRAPEALNTMFSLLNAAKSNTERINLMSKIFGNDAEVARLTDRLRTNVPLMQKYVEMANSAAAQKSLQQEFDIKINSMTGQYKRLSAVMEGMAIKVGTPFAAAFTDLFRTQWIPQLQAFSESMSKNPGAIKEFATNVVSAIDAIVKCGVALGSGVFKALGGLATILGDSRLGGGARMGDGLVKLAAGLVAITAAAGAVSVITSLALALPAIGTGLATMGSIGAIAISAPVLPWLALAAGIVAAGAAIKHFTVDSESWNTGIGMMKGQISGLIAQFQKLKSALTLQNPFKGWEGFNKVPDYKNLKKQEMGFKMPDVGAMFGKITGALSSFAGKVGGVANRIGTALCNGIKTGVTAAVGAVRAMGAAILAVTAGLVGQMLSQGARMGRGLANGIKSGAAAAVGAVRAMGAAIIGVVNGIAGGMMAAGARIGQALAAGIRSGIGAVTSAASALASAAGNYLVGHSPIPKGVLHNLSLPTIPLQLAEGMKNISPVIQSARQLAQSLMQNMTPNNVSGLRSAAVASGGGGISYVVNINVSGGSDNQKLAEVINSQIRNANTQFVQKLESFLEHKNRTSFSASV